MGIETHLQKVIRSQGGSPIGSASYVTNPVDVIGCSRCNEGMVCFANIDPSDKDQSLLAPGQYANTNLRFGAVMGNDELMAALVYTIQDSLGLFDPQLAKSTRLRTVSRAPLPGTVIKVEPCRNFSRADLKYIQSLPFD